MPDDSGGRHRAMRRPLRGAGGDLEGVGSRERHEIVAATAAA
jgi:hypothetical protein